MIHCFLFVAIATPIVTNLVLAFMMVQATQKPSQTVSNERENLQLSIPNSQISEFTSHLHEFEYLRVSKQVHNLIREFSLQIAHQRIHFTAAEFYEINYNLLGSVIQV